MTNIFKNNIYFRTPEGKRAVSFEIPVRTVPATPAQREDFFDRLRAERGIKTPAKVAINYTDGGRVGAGFIHEKKDCAVRALALLKGWTYAEAHKFWADRGRKPGKGAYWVECLKDAQVERADEFKGGSVEKVLARLPKGERFVIRVAGHVFAVVDGVPQDTFRPKARGHVKGIYRNKLDSTPAVV